MAYATSHPQLVQDFLDAVRDRQMDRCEAILAQLSQEAQTEAALAPWQHYCEGILANERDHDLAAAERIFLGLLDETASVDLELQGRLCLALAVTYRRQSRLEECVAICQRSLPVYAALGDVVGEAKALKQIVIAYVTGFDQALFGAEVLPLAVELCHRALALLDAAPASTENKWLQGTLWNEVGALHRVRQEWDQAVEAYERYRDIHLALGHRFGAGLAEGNLGEIYFKQGKQRWAAARDAFTIALESAREFSDRGHELEALANLAYLEQQQGRFEDALERYRQVIALVGELRAGVSSETARTGFFATVTETFANAVLTAQAGGQADLAFAWCEQARARSFLDLLASETDELYRQAADTLTTSQVQAALAGDDLLMAYFTTGLRANVETGDRQSYDRHRFPPGRTLLFLVTCESVQVIENNLLPNDLRPRRLTNAAERHFLQPAIRRTLYDRLIGPVAPLLAGKRRLYIVPHGPLHYVPFQALLAPDGETLLRPGGPEIVYGPSASVLFREHAAARPLGFPKTPRVSELPCLALGFDGEDGQRLRFAEEEARRIAALLGGEALVGPANKREALFQRGPAARTLHISCHGQFDAEAPLASFLHLGAGETLTAHDVLASLRLRCDLVTLSACESGLSQVRRGDELMGLVRAFMAAGAPAVLATLWRVDERSTRLLMEHFYQAVAAGADFAGALQQAQLFLQALSREEALDLLGGDASGAGWAERPFDDPFYWAPFILIGSG